MAGSSSVHIVVEDKAIDEQECTATKVDKIPTVIILSDDEHEAVAAQCKVVQSRQKLHRRRAASRRQLLQVPPSDVILITSSDSSEGDTTHAIPKSIVQRFNALKIGEELPLKTSPIKVHTVEVQTEITLPPKVFLESNMVKAMLSSEAVGMSKVASPYCTLQQPVLEASSLALEDMDASKKSPIGKPYEGSSAGELIPSLSLQETSISLPQSLFELDKVEIGSVDPCLSSPNTTKMIFGQAYKAAAAPPCVLEEPNMQVSSMTSKNASTSAKMIFGQPFEDASVCTSIAFDTLQVTSGSISLGHAEAEESATKGAATHKKKKVTFNQTPEVAMREDVCPSKSIESAIRPPTYTTRSKAKEMEKEHKVDNI